VDPEIPVVTIAELGILREVRLTSEGALQVIITPTYSGCPAMLAIRDTIEKTLAAAGVESFEIKQVLSPAWTTDWITQSARDKMKAYGIAPPVQRSKNTDTPITLHAKSDNAVGLSQVLFEHANVNCPRCDSDNTQRISAFGSTACQEQWRCLSCSEPFDHFKCH